MAIRFRTRGCWIFRGQNGPLGARGAMSRGANHHRCSWTKARKARGLSARMLEKLLLTGHEIDRRRCIEGLAISRDVAVRSRLWATAYGKCFAENHSYAERESGFHLRRSSLGRSRGNRNSRRRMDSEELERRKYGDVRNLSSLALIAVRIVFLSVRDFELDVRSLVRDCTWPCIIRFFPFHAKCIHLVGFSGCSRAHRTVAHTRMRLERSRRCERQRLVHFGHVFRESRTSD